MALNSIFLVLCGYGLLLLQMHPLLPYGKYGFRPDCILALVIYSALYGSRNRGALLCFFLGYGVELVSGAPGGLYSIIYVSIFCLIKVLKKYLNFDTLWKRCCLLLISCVVKLCILLVCIFFIHEISYQDVQGTFFKETVFTFVLFPFIFAVISRVHYNQKPSSGFYSSARNDHTYSV